MSWYRRALMLLPVAASALSSGFAQEGITRKLDEYLNRATESALFAGSVAIAKDGKILFSRGFGMANLADDVHNTAQTRFDIGSVSKTFIAALVLRLQDDRVLRVDDPICKYLDNCPDAWRPITIRHLLTHTSGILNYTDLPDYFERRALDSFLPDAMKRIRAMPLQFRPGDRFAYSNTGPQPLNTSRPRYFHTGQRQLRIRLVRL